MTGSLAHLAAGTASAFLAFLFLRAALHKASDLTWFEGVLGAYGVRASLAGLLSRALPALEAACAVALLVPGARRLGAATAILLLTIYAGAMAAQLLGGRRLVDCGCGGAPQALSWALAARNAVLVAAAAPVVLGVGGAQNAAEALAMAGCAIAAFIAWIAVEQLAANDARMRRPAASSVFADDFAATGGAT